MPKLETVARFVDAIGSLWGRDPSAAAVAAYLEVADPYTEPVTVEACGVLLKGAKWFPLPTDLRAALKDVVAKSRVKALPPPEDVAKPEQIRKCIDSYFRAIRGQSGGSSAPGPETPNEKE